MMSHSKLLYTVWIIILATLISLTACKKHKYLVPDEFEEYLNRFETQAEIHGEKINFEKSGLIIQYVKDVDYHGVCYHEKPIRIEINETYWSEAEDARKEHLIFHELGHGFLDRRHLDAFLSNGEDKSIMRSGGIGYDHENYRGFRKEYYIDELFDENISAPSWSSVSYNYNDFYDDYGNQIIKDDFNYDNDTWFTGTSSGADASISNGYYYMEGKADKKTTSSLNIPLNVNEDYMIEARLKLEADDGSAVAGFLWGDDNTYNKSYFFYNAGSYYIIGNYNLYGPWAVFQNSGINSSGFNKLSVFKKSNIFYFFLNDQFIYYTDMEAINNIELSIMLDGYSKVTVDYVYIYTLNSFYKGDGNKVMPKGKWNVLPDMILKPKGKL